MNSSSVIYWYKEDSYLQQWLLAITKDYLIEEMIKLLGFFLIFDFTKAFQIRLKVKPREFINNDIFASTYFVINDMDFRVLPEGGIEISHTGHKKTKNQEVRVLLGGLLK